VTEEDRQLIRKAGKALQVGRKLAALQEEVESLRVRAEIEGVDLSREISELEGSIAKFEAEEESFGGGIQHPATKALEEGRRITELLHKLDEKRAGISASVYARLEQEYRQNLTAAENLLAEQIQVLSRIREQSEEQISLIRNEIEEASVRTQLGEWGPEEGARKLSVLEQKKDELQETIDGVRMILERIPE